jgi:hypothetical protein
VPESTAESENQPSIAMEQLFEWILVSHEYNNVETSKKTTPPPKKIFKIMLKILKITR